MVVKRLAFSDVRVGMIVAEDIFSRDDQLIISQGTEVDEYILNRLKQFSVRRIAIYIIDKVEEVEASTTANFPKTHYEKLRASEEFINFSEEYTKVADEFKLQLNEIVSNNSETIDFGGLLSSVDSVLSKAPNAYHVFDMLHNIKDFDDSTYSHSLNVAMLANVLGKWLELSEADIRCLTVSGMLHDVGKLLIPQEIITKPSRLTDEEFEVIKEHPVRGYKLLKSKEVQEHVARVALMHHEKCDGSGYPMGIKGPQISDYAKMITIIDIYEAMTANRVYRRGMCPFEVIRLYEEEGFQKYDIKYLLTFLNGIANTYINNTVVLNDGRCGEIVMNNASILSRPIIRIANEFVDLSVNKQFKIVNIL